MHVRELMEAMASVQQSQNYIPYIYKITLEAIKAKHEILNYQLLLKQI